MRYAVVCCASDRMDLHVIIRSKYVAEKLGYRKVPVVIRVLKGEDAMISMADSNLQRENILPSEKASICV